MYLKSLTLKGFKSFAAPTTLRFEPGITAVVGPNGSGKSNVVDALAWVMGEQGAKTLRGGKMEDVIFAGTSSRAPLGRAEVTVSIDNSDNALPIEYTEVSITRRMFRDGASEYEINGSSCRLMDVQELLSDSGIGREMHVIVGQGKLDPLGQPCHALIDRFDTRPHGLHLASQPRQSLTAVRLLPDRRQVCPVGLGGAALPVGQLCTGSIESGTRRVQLR